MPRDDEALHSTLTGASAVLAGGGALTMAFFPFLLPILILTIVFAAPLLLIGLVPALLVGALLLVARAIRRVRWRGRRTPPPTTERPRPEIRAGSGAATAS
jgi:hypothetical protein